MVITFGVGCSAASQGFALAQPPARYGLRGAAPSVLSLAPASGSTATATAVRLARAAVDHVLSGEADGPATAQGGAR